MTLITGLWFCFVSILFTNKISKIFISKYAIVFDKIMGVLFVLISIKLIWSSLSNEIICIENKENKGLPYCLNKGIEKAQGKFFLRLDSDDYVNEFYIEALYNFLVMNEHYDAVACDYVEVDDSEKFLRRRDCFKNPLGCGIIFNKQHWLDIGKYDEDFKLHEEIDFIIRFKSKYTLGRLEMPLYRYRKHSDSITNDLENVNKYNKKLKEKHKNL